MMFRIRHQRIGKVVCCNLLVGETEGTLRLAGSFILSNEEWDEFTLHPVTRLEANESCAALCVGPLDFVPPIERDRYALILEDTCYLTTLAIAAEHAIGEVEPQINPDNPYFDEGALHDIRNALEPHRADRPISDDTAWPPGVSARDLPVYDPGKLSDGFPPRSFIPQPPTLKLKIGDVARITKVPELSKLCGYLNNSHVGVHVQVMTIENGLYRAQMSNGPLIFADDDMLEKIT